MAIYSLNISSVNRSKGSNACKTLSYITGEKVYDERLGQIHNYGRNERVEHHAMILPPGATFKSEIELINSIEQYETNDSSVIAKKVMVALPIEFSKEQDIEVVEKYIKDNFTSKNYACVYALHDIGTDNPHAHILIPARELDEQGQWKEVKATKVYAIYEKGHKFENEKIPTLDQEKIAAYEKENGKTFNELDFEYDELLEKFQKLGSRNRKQWKRVNAKKNKITEKGFLKEIRADWSAKCNELLPQSQHIDHRSYKDQGIDDIEPTIHKGYKTTAAEKKNGWNERLERFTDIQTYNYETRNIKSFLSINMRRIKEQVNERIRSLETTISRFRTAIGNLGERATSRFRRIEQIIERAEDRRADYYGIREQVRELRTRIKSIEQWNERVEQEHEPIVQPIPTPQPTTPQRMDLNSIKERAKKRGKTDKQSINNPFNVYFNHIVQLAIREQADTQDVLEWMYDNDNKFNRWVNSLSNSEWENFRDSIYEKVEEKMEELDLDEHDDHDEWGL